MIILYCKNCGNKLEKNSNFCNKCGELARDYRIYQRRNKIKWKRIILVISGVTILSAIVVLVVGKGFLGEGYTNEQVECIPKNTSNIGTNERKVTAPPLVSSCPTIKKANQTTPAPSADATKTMVDTWMLDKDGLVATLDADGDLWTATLSGANPQKTYLVDLLDWHANEYLWEITFSINGERFYLHTLYVSQEEYPGRELALCDMDSKVVQYFKVADSTYKVETISIAKLSVVDDVMIWTFPLHVDGNTKDVSVDDICINLSSATVNSEENIPSNPSQQTNRLEYEGLVLLLDGNSASVIGYNGKKTQLEIPEEIEGYKVVAISESAFYESNLVSIIVPNSVTSIGAYAFCGSSKLSSIKLSNSLDTIGESAFAGCIKLSSIEIPYGVEYLSDHLFSACTGLRRITLPDSIIGMGNEVFYRCRDDLEYIASPGFWDRVTQY